MKLPPFEYACPTSISEAVALLASHDGDAKPLAGGQSLVPMLAFRVAQPSLLDDARLRTAHPLLVAAVEHVAYYQIRNRGTVGGSMAHADPAAEMPGIAVTCEAQISVTGKCGSRVIKAADFFH